MDIGTPNSNDGKKIIIHYFVTESSKDIKYSPKTKDIQVLIYIMEIVPIIASAFVLAPKTTVNLDLSSWWIQANRNY